MSHKTRTQPKWSLASASLRDAYSDFVLSHQAAQYSPATHNYYKFTTGKFIEWLESNGVTSPQEVTPRLVRQYLGELSAQGKGAPMVYAHARTIRTLMRFWQREKYTTEAASFDMPRQGERRLPVLSAAQVELVLAACDNLRDRLLVLFLVDTGLRREEVCALNWGDIDFSTGQVVVRRGKGGKARVAVCGARVRRDLLRYRRTLRNAADSAPVFQARGGIRFKGAGLLRIFQRLTKKTGLKVSPHVCRRTFATLSALAGMPVPLLQAMLGHSDLTMTLRYIRLAPGDLLEAHRVHSPIDNLGRLK